MDGGSENTKKQHTKKIQHTTEAESVREKETERRGNATTVE